MLREQKRSENLSLKYVIDKEQEIVFRVGSKPVLKKGSPYACQQFIVAIEVTGVQTWV